MIELVDANLIENIISKDVIEDELDEVIKIGEEMINFCAENGHLGLAAPQIGIFKNFFVFSPKKQIYQIIINPNIYPTRKVIHTIEACLSYPGKQFYVSRYKYISTTFYGKNAKTNKMQKVNQKFSGDAAIIFQHEYNHLTGKTLNVIGKEIGES